MKIKSYLREYEVSIEERIDFAAMPYSDENSLMVIDAKVYQLYKETSFKNINLEKLLLIEAKEENKTVDKSLEICEKMTAFSAKKNSVIVAIGGGIIQDICSLAANILYRGTRLVLVPTTLLSQTDSCIGSKSSINFGKYKNLLGYFYPPERIAICFDFLKSLESVDYRSGLGEIYKINVMAGAERVDVLAENLPALLSRDYEALQPFVNHALSFKKCLIEEDEFDIGKRRILNYGHTFGHGIEYVSGYDIPHGIGVMMGAKIANRISFDRGYIPKAYMEKLNALANKIIPEQLLSYSIDPQQLIDAVKKDKKRQGQLMAGVLLENEGSLRVFQDIDEKEIEQALN